SQDGEYRVDGVMRWIIPYATTQSSNCLNYLKKASDRGHWKGCYLGAAAGRHALIQFNSTIANILSAHEQFKEDYYLKFMVMRSDNGQFVKHPTMGFVDQGVAPPPGQAPLLHSVREKIEKKDLIDGAQFVISLKIFYDGEAGQQGKTKNSSFYVACVLCRGEEEIPPRLLSDCIEIADKTLGNVEKSIGIQSTKRARSSSGNDPASTISNDTASTISNDTASTISNDTASTINNDTASTIKNDASGTIKWIANYMKKKYRNKYPYAVHISSSDSDGTPTHRKQKGVISSFRTLEITDDSDTEVYSDKDAYSGAVDHSSKDVYSSTEDHSDTENTSVAQ
ncbi:unnamed protein product, partial [Rotaria magnacalcarata]